MRRDETGELGMLIRVRYADRGGMHRIKRVIYASQPVTIGRADGCKIVLKDPLASNFHARLTYDSLNGLVIEDLDSSNGVLVNGEKVLQCCRITEDDTVRIGDTPMQFKLAGPYRESDQERTQPERRRRVAPVELLFDIEEEGEPRRERFVLSNDLTMGRDQDCDIMLTSQTVSRKQLRLINLGSEGVGLVELQSSNEVLVNGKRIKGLVLLASGDEVAFGEAKFRLTF